MVSQEQVNNHLKKLEEYIQELEKLRSSASLEGFLNDKGLQDRVERNLHLAIESVIDIGNQIISEYGYRLPETYGDVFIVLAENKVISRDFAEVLVKMAGFRNVLVHDYLKINKERVYENLQKLGDFNKFVQKIEQFIS